MLNVCVCVFIVNEFKHILLGREGGLTGALEGYFKDSEYSV